MEATGHCSRAEVLVEHNDSVPRGGATSNPVLTRSLKNQRTYSKRALKSLIQPLIPDQNDILIDTPSLSPFPPENHASRATIPMTRSISALGSNHVQRTAFQPSLPSREISSIGSPQGSLQSQRHAPRTPNPRTRSISDFFRPISHSSRSSSPIRRHNISSPISSSPQTIPSSPPCLITAKKKENYPLHEEPAANMGRKENISLEHNFSDRKRKDEYGIEDPELMQQVNGAFTRKHERNDNFSKEESSEFAEDNAGEDYTIRTTGWMDSSGDNRPRKARRLMLTKSNVINSKTKTNAIKKPKLTQATLNMAAHGATVREPETCECSFLSKDFSIEEEAQHKKFHDNHFKPISVKGYSFSGEGCPSTAVVGASGHMFSVISISRHHAAKWQTLAEKVIARVEVDVSGRKLERDELWSETTIHGGINVPRFRVFLCVKNHLVVSVLIVELIVRARVVKMVPCDALGNINVEDSAGEVMTEHKLEYTKRLSAATMGVHYIWTHEKYRKQGFAVALLNFARRGGFLAGYYAARGSVAFTDLTEAGKQFAARYLREGSVFGSEWEYLEYDSVA